MTTAQPVFRSRAEIALAVLRIVVGIVFIAHGAQKLFVYGHAGVAGGFVKMGIPLPEITSWIVAIVEFFGGIALVLGIVTELAAALLAIDMLCAIVLVHMKNGFFAPMGAEFPLSLLASAVALIIGGGGAWSVDRRIRRRES